MSEPLTVEDSSIFFLVEETSRIHTTVTFLQRRGLTVESHSDIKEFLLSCNKHHPNFLGISVNHHNPKVFELIEILGSQLRCEVIVFAEKPDRRSLPLIRRAKHAHKLLGAMSGPSMMLKMRKISRRQQKPSAPGKIVIETVEGSSVAPGPEHFLITEGKDDTDRTFTSDVRRRGEGPSLFKNEKQKSAPLIWQDARGTGPSYVYDSKPASERAAPKIEVEDSSYKAVAKWIEDGLRNTVHPDMSEPLPFPPHTKKLAVVQVKDSSESGYLILASSKEDELQGKFLEQLHKSLKDLKSLPAGPQWESFKLLDVDVSDVQNWLKELTQARVLSKHQSTELMASFLSSEASIPKLIESLKGHYALSVANIRPDRPIDYDTFLHLKLNDKLIQYVSRGGCFSQQQLDKLTQLKGSPLLIRKEDLELFEAQFLRENILQLTTKAQKKKAA